MPPLVYPHCTIDLAQYQVLRGGQAVPLTPREVALLAYLAGRVGEVQDIVQAVAYLAGAGFVTGQILTVDGGMTRKMIYTA